MCTTDDWDDCFVESFLEQYEKYECLWNPFDPSFNDCVQRTEALTQILKNLNNVISFEDSLKLVRCIRQRYELEIKQRDLIEEEGRSRKTGWRLILENMLKRVAHNEECKVCERIRKGKILSKKPFINAKFPSFRDTVTSRLRKRCNDPKAGDNNKDNINCFTGCKKRGILPCRKATVLNTGNLNTNCKSKKKVKGKKKVKNKLERESRYTSYVEKTREEACPAEYSRPPTSWCREHVSYTDSAKWADPVDCQLNQNAVSPGYASHLQRLSRLENLCKDAATAAQSSAADCNVDNTNADKCCKRREEQEQRNARCGQSDGRRVRHPELQPAIPNPRSCRQTCPAVPARSTSCGRNKPATCSSPTRPTTASRACFNNDKAPTTDCNSLADRFVCPCAKKANNNDNVACPKPAAVQPNYCTRSTCPNLNRTTDHPRRRCSPPPPTTTTNNRHRSVKSACCQTAEQLSAPPVCVPTCSKKTSTIAIGCRSRTTSPTNCPTRTDFCQLQPSQTDEPTICKDGPKRRNQRVGCDEIEEDPRLQGMRTRCPKMSARFDKNVIEAYSQFKLVLPDGTISTTCANNDVVHDDDDKCRPDASTTSKFSRKVQTEPKSCKERACTVRSEDLRIREDKNDDDDGCDDRARGFKRNANCGTDDRFVACCHERDNECESLEAEETSQHDYVLLTPGGKYVPLVRAKDGLSDEECCVDAVGKVIGQSGCDNAVQQTRCCDKKMQATAEDGRSSSSSTTTTKMLLRCLEQMLNLEEQDDKDNNCHEESTCDPRRRKKPTCQLQSSCDKDTRSRRNNRCRPVAATPAAADSCKAQKCKSRSVSPRGRLTQNFLQVLRCALDIDGNNNKREEDCDDNCDDEIDRERPVDCQKNRKHRDNRDGSTRRGTDNRRCKDVDDIEENVDSACVDVLPISNAHCEELKNHPKCQDIGNRSSDKRRNVSSSRGQPRAKTSEKIRALTADYENAKHRETTRRNSRRRCRFEDDPRAKLSYCDDDVEIEYRREPQRFHSPTRLRLANQEENELDPCRFQKRKTAYRRQCDDNSDEDDDVFDDNDASFCTLGGAMGVSYVNSQRHRSFVVNPLNGRRNE